MTVYYVSHEDCIEAVRNLAACINSAGAKFEHIYPVPRGGNIPGALLAEELGLPIEHDKNTIHPAYTLIVDDVVDSGETRFRFKDFYFAALHVKKSTPETLFETCNTTFWAEMVDCWIEYWWEGSSSGGIEDNIKRILEYIGENPNREGLLETPARVVRSWDTLFSGYKCNPADFMKVFEDDKHDELILLKDIEFYSTCEHHILPFSGKAHVGYIPEGNRVLGISKLARLVECFSRRLQIQERLTNQVAHEIMNTLHPKGVACIIEAQHHCMTSRGVGKQNSVMITSAMLGVFRDDPRARAEFTALVK